MRPWVALVVSLGSAAAWWGLAGWPSDPVALIPLAAAVLAATLVFRRRLGRVASRGFVAQAALLLLFGLAQPVRVGGGMTTSLLMSPFAAPQVSGILGPPPAVMWPFVLLGLAWALTVVWLALVAWTEQAPAVDG
jgi:hypothetical protein